MADTSDVRRLALSLPDTVQNRAGTSFEVNDVGFASPYPERVHPKKPRVERLDIFVIHVMAVQLPREPRPTMSPRTMSRP